MCVRVFVCVYSNSIVYINSIFRGMCSAAFIEEEDSVLKLHQQREINQSPAVINNRVIRSLFPQ